MKGLKAKVTKGIQVGTRVKIADNSGAKEIEIIAVKGYRSVKSRLAKCGVGDVVIGAVKVGNPDVKHTLVTCVIIRQRKAYRRKNGVRVKFEDNAAIVMKDLKKGEPKGTVIKGPVAREVIERFPLITRIATMVV
ncbi:MAG: uL14 family ribosomal protein [Nanoarchaeota archaeon]|nr:uL14 family ribosomal protein [Nanoarchaeota archaeon]